MKHLIDIMQLGTEEIDEMIDVAKDIIAHPEKYAEKCHGKKLATLFFEPSTLQRDHTDRSGRDRIRYGYLRQTDAPGAAQKALQGRRHKMDQKAAAN